MTLQIWALEIVQERLIKTGLSVCSKMDVYFVLPSYQRDTSKFQDMCINVLEDWDLPLLKI